MFSKQLQNTIRKAGRDAGREYVKLGRFRWLNRYEAAWIGASDFPMWTGCDGDQIAAARGLWIEAFFTEVNNELDMLQKSNSGKAGTAHVEMSVVQSSHRCTTDERRTNHTPPAKETV